MSLDTEMQHQEAASRHVLRSGQFRLGRRTVEHFINAVLKCHDSGVGERVERGMTCHRQGEHPQTTKSNEVRV